MPATLPMTLMPTLPPDPDEEPLFSVRFTTHVGVIPSAPRAQGRNVVAGFELCDALPRHLTRKGATLHCKPTPRPKAPRSLANKQAAHARAGSRCKLFSPGADRVRWTSTGRQDSMPYTCRTP